MLIGGTSMFVWKNEFEIGIKIIDDQHKELFRIANSAYELLNDEYVVDKFNKIMDLIEKLRDYCEYHFQCEENYQLEIGYKKYFSHKVEHDDFIKRFKNIENEQIDKNQEKFIEDLLVFFVEWITNHILQKDKTIA
jgi:hemerythrin